VPVKLQAVTLAAKLLVLSPANGTLIQLAKYVFALARYDRNYDVRDRGRMLQQLLVGVVPDIAATDAEDVGGVVLRRAQVRVVLFEGKAIASPPSSHAAAAHHDHDAARRGYDHDLGTLGLVLGRDVPDARLLPDWLEHGVESSLRYVPDDALPSSSAAAVAVTAIGHVAPSSSRAGSGGHSTPIVVLTPVGSSGGPSPAGSVPNKAGWADLDAFYASESEEEEEEESEDEEGEAEESGKGEDEEEDEDEDGEEEGGNSGDDSDRQSGESEHEVRRAGLLRASDEEDGTGSDVEGAGSQIAAISVR
jgi:AP-3 complex subunit beta